MGEINREISTHPWPSKNWENWHLLNWLKANKNNKKHNKNLHQPEVWNQLKLTKYTNIEANMSSNPPATLHWVRTWEQPGAQQPPAIKELSHSPIHGYSYAMELKWKITWQYNYYKVKQWLDKDT